MSAIFDIVNSVLPNNGDTGGLLGLAGGAPFAGDNTGFVDIAGSPFTAGTDLQPLARAGGSAALGALAGGINFGDTLGATAGVDTGFAGDVGTFGSESSGFGTDSSFIEGGSGLSSPPGMSPGADQFGNFDMGSGPSGTEPFTGGEATPATKSITDNLSELWKKYQSLTKSPIGTAYNIGSGLYGLLQGRNLQQLAKTAADKQDPFASQRAQYQQMLAQLTSTGDVTKLPGYAAGLEAVNRGQAAGGYLGSGNQVLANSTYGTNLYNSTVAQLGGLAGGNFAPGGAGNTLLSGNVSGLQLQGNALNRLGMGASQLFTP